ncbi:MAG: 23S rRNA (adenine(2503)-C(2))-methyltransferase RlmN, partial [Candidatus Schekmanbacteria bacterium RBG_16_38_11]
MKDKIDLLNLTLPEIDSFLESLGLEGYRSSQIKRWIFKEGVTAFDQMSNLSKKTKSLLEENSFLSRLKIEKILLSSDGAKKYIFQVDQENTIESVLIPDKSRLTLCISTQAGCSRGCKFCLTGKKGLSRNLTSSEIINQVLEVKRDIGKEIRISNLVIMGMGEPLDNFENVKKTVTIMLDREGFDFSSRRITLSTSGVIPGIKDLIESGLNINLAVSLNASSDKKRDVLMPVN